MKFPIEQRQLNVTLLLDRVIVKPMKVETEVRKTGIIIPDYIKQSQQNVPRFGEVVAAGPGDPNRNGGAMTVKVGDFVSFFFHSGTPFEFGGVTHLLMREFDITMIVNEYTRKEEFTDGK